MGKSQDVQNPLVVSNGLIGYWSFNDGSGSIARDFSGNNHNATLSGASLPLWINGRIGTGLKFNGSNTSMLISNNSYFGIGNSIKFSITLWFNAASINSYDNLFSCGPCDNVVGTNNSIILGLYSTTAMYVDSWGVYYTPTATIPLNTWHFVVLTGNGTTWVLYLNGTILDQRSMNPTCTNTSAFTRIGMCNDATYPRHFNGLIDGVRVYNRALNQSEITALYLAT